MLFTNDHNVLILHQYENDGSKDIAIINAKYSPQYRVGRSMQRKEIDNILRGFCNLQMTKMFHVLYHWKMDGSKDPANLTHKSLLWAQNHCLTRQVFFILFCFCNKFYMSIVVTFSAMSSKTCFYCKKKVLIGKME